MKRLLCRVFGHRWRWVGWVYRMDSTTADLEMFECTRCQLAELEEFGG